MLKRVLVSSALMLVAVSSMACAGVPDPGQSSGDERIGASPVNCNVTGAYKFVYSYTLRDATGAPVVGYPAGELILNFRECFNPTTRTTDYVQADGPSDANGRVTWSTGLEFGGADPCPVYVQVGGLPFELLQEADYDFGGGLRSPDQNGDGVVDLVDLVVWQPAFVDGGPMYRGDYTMDDAITLSDLGFFQVHFIEPAGCN